MWRVSGRRRERPTDWVVGRRGPALSPMSQSVTREMRSTRGSRDDLRTSAPFGSARLPVRVFRRDERCRRAGARGAGTTEGPENRQAKVGQLIPTSHFRGRAVTWAIDTDAMSNVGTRRWRDGITGIALVAIGLSIGVAACSSSGDFGAATDRSAPAASSTPATSSSVAPAAKPAVCANVKGAQVMADGMVMAPVPTGAPAPADAARRADVSRVGARRSRQVLEAVGRGRRRLRARDQPQRLRRALRELVGRPAGDVLDPNRPSSLVYAEHEVGSAPARRDVPRPRALPTGTRCRRSRSRNGTRTPTCASRQRTRLWDDPTPAAACSVGTHNTNTYFMMHVWTAPSSRRATSSRRIHRRMRTPRSSAAESRDLLLISLCLLLVFGYSRTYVRCW